MAAPPPEEYLAADFDPNSLRVPQLRSILLAHGHGYPSTAKKADLISEFQLHVLSKASTLRNAAASVRPSAKGIITVSENGDEAAAIPAKRPRGRSRKPTTVEPEDVPEPEPEAVIVVEETSEPPTKKSRGRAKKSMSVEVDIPLPSARKPRGRPSRAAIQAEEVDEGVEAEIEDEATPAPSSRRGRGSLPPSSPGSLLSAPASVNRRRSNIGSSSSVSTELRTPSVGPPDVNPRSTGKKATSALNIMDNLREESEKEDETPKKITKPKTPRRSTGDDSGFSDFNPFQSGSEEAAQRERRRRKSSLGVASAIKSKPAQPRFSEPAPNVSTPTSILRKVGPSRENLRTPPSAVKELLRSDVELDEAVQYNRAVQDKLNQISSNDVSDDLQVSISSTVDQTPNTSLAKRVQDQVAVVPHARKALPLGALFLLLLSLVLNYKGQSSSIGFCDSGAHVNNVILNRQNSLEAAQACVYRKAQVDLEDPQAAKSIHCDGSALPLLPFVPRPTACAPCPLHATCNDGKLDACEPEYLIRSHPLSFVAPLVDGLPGLGPEAFPPSCRPDTAKKRMIGGLAQEMEKELAKGRGVIVCSGWQNEGDKKTVGERFGVEESALREIFAARRDPKFSKEQFDEVFEAALKDLVEHEDVIESIDLQGQSWYAASRTDITLGCRAKLEAKDLVDRWKSQLGYTAAVIAAITYLNSEVKKRRSEKVRAEQLVEVALGRLQDQEQLHYVDPVTTPHSYIPRDQLRDLVMPPKGSTASRSRLWAKVQDIIEGNANVAVRDREVKGEVWRTWEWSGVGERHVTFE